ncbi:MAG: tyrosine-type recombinase/integrase [Planctomycetota bacterium]
MTSGTYHITIPFGGKRYKRSLKTKDRRIANSIKARVEETVMLVESGRITIPPKVDLPSFLLSDGKVINFPTFERLGLKAAFEEYFDSLPIGSLEPRTIEMLKIHSRHLQRKFGPRFNLAQLSHADLQSYVSHRSKAKGVRGRNLHPGTIKKELCTLGVIWKWAISTEKLPKAKFPSEGLKYPKSEQQSEFQTFEGVSRQTRDMNPESAEAKELWASVFLNRDEIEELLDYVCENARHRFIYPMFVVAAHTGCRRSEIIRSRINDFNDRTLIVREKKRKKGVASTRKVPVSTRLREAIDVWFDEKPDSEYSICHAYLSSCHSQPGEPLSPDQANKHFKNTLKKSRFAQLRGWHVFRHSFCSNCAAAGIDQRIIDSWVGHTTEEMRHRYRHLFPNQQHQIHQELFG